MSDSTFLANIEQYLDEAGERPIIITDEDGKPDLVLLDFNYYAQLKQFDEQRVAHKLDEELENKDHEKDDSDPAP